jgi:hypothetical protein
MRYLLIGNAPNCADAVVENAAHADVIIQCNGCTYAEVLPSVRDNYVFVSNTAPKPEIIGAIEHRLTSLRSLPVFTSTSIILCRNPRAYTLGAYLLRGRLNVRTEFFELNRFWPVRAVSFVSTVRLHTSLLKLGMQIRQMPSTGMVAYDWIRRRLRPTDSLLVAGFTHQGWQGHPWHLEREIIKPVIGDRR